MNRDMMLEEVKKEITTSFLEKEGYLKIEKIEDIYEEYIYLELEESFIYVNEYKELDFKIFPYIKEKIEQLNKGIMFKGETEDTIKSFQKFEKELQEIILSEHNLEMYFLRVAI